ncbi:flagellar filament capping protein FliD [Bacillaceae bacterium SIJ1]|uniref:flagellar filament capping protein FliD n=1 Tax=Litoribacterium kuwaitense TaxID=1398745 RepID=UPI0013EA2E52|nr:flagellar filament capping protein FliD [Litoribacterium kuwaitense]NGP44929.1 flagellar filament capping protein FliD [Litoribacterium kuwaitense]
MNTNRISGLASGMDTEQIIRDLMKAERLPLDRMYQKKTIMEWQRDQYREINKKLLELRDATFDFKLSSTFSSRNVASSNDTFVTATANSNALLASFNISEVSRLATAAQRLSTQSIEKNGETIDLNKSLWSQKGSFDQMPADQWRKGAVEYGSTVTNASGRTFSFLKGDIKTTNGQAEAVVKVDGQSFEVVTGVDPATLNENQVLLDTASGELTFGKTIDKQSQIDVNYVANSRTDSFTVGEEPSYNYNLARKSIAGEAGAGSVLSSVQVTVDGQDYTVVTDLNELESGANRVYLNQETGQLKFSTSDANIAEDAKIEVTYQQNYTSASFGVYDENGEEQKTSLFIQGSDSFSTFMSQLNRDDTGVKAFYDEFTGRFSLTRSESGNFNDAGDEINLYGSFMNDILKLGAETGGENAKFTINGIETERRSNQFTQNGVEFQLNSTFTQADGPVTLTVTNNSDDVFERIKGYVEKYNELVDLVNSKTMEERYRDFHPLTDEQKQEMTERQVELWEEKAQSGLLKSDPMLNGLLSGIRMDLYGKVESNAMNSQFDQISEIGITTSPDYLSGGKLVINESKLKEALQTDPESVEALFNASGESTAKQGIAQRLYDTMDSYMERITDKAGRSTMTNEQFSLGKKIDDMSSRMERFEDRLTMIENRYYRQFTAMEQAIQRSNQQGAYIMQQFGGGGMA